jgi:hypothetical protein
MTRRTKFGKKKRSRASTVERGKKITTATGNWASVVTMVIM